MKLEYVELHRQLRRYQKRLSCTIRPVERADVMARIEYVKNKIQQYKVLKP